MNDLSLHTKRSIVYSLLVSIGLVFLLNVRLITYGKFWYLFIASILFVLLLAEFIFSYIYNSKVLQNHPLKHLVQQIHEHHSSQYVYLSMSLYILDVLFIYFNQVLIVNMALIIGSGFLFFYLFNEVRKTYLSDFKVSEYLSIVFDVTKAVLYFTLCYILTHLFLDIPNNFLYVAGILFVFQLFNMLFSSHHDVPLHSNVILAVIVSLAASLVYIFIFNSGKVTNFISVAGIASLSALTGMNIYHHEQEKTLTVDSLIEYFVVSLLILILLFTNFTN